MSTRMSKLSTAHAHSASLARSLGRVARRRHTDAYQRLWRMLALEAVTLQQLRPQTLPLPLVQSLPPPPPAPTESDAESDTESDVDTEFAARLLPASPSSAL